MSTAATLACAGWGLFLFAAALFMLVGCDYRERCQELRTERAAHEHTRKTLAHHLNTHANERKAYTFGSPAQRVDVADLAAVVSPADIAWPGQRKGGE